MQARKKKFSMAKVKTEQDVDNSSFEENSSKPNKVKDKNVKAKKRKRLIIRNLSFQVTPDELQDTFSKFGNVVNVNIPLKEDGRKRGFAFVEFEDFKSLIKSMKALNNKEIHGRRVAIDYAVDKTNYQLKLQSIKKEKEDSPQKQLDTKLNSLSDDESEEEKPDISSIKDEEEEDMDENEKRVNEFLKEFDSGIEAVQNEDHDSSDESLNNSEAEEDHESDEEEEESDDENDSSFNKQFQDTVTSHSPKDKLSSNKKISEDVSEGKTVFLRNVSFATTKESLRGMMEKYGELEYCLICVDPITDHSKGTAFVKFKNKESADKLIEESLDEPGVLVDGRKLTCALAVSKQTISEQNDHLKKPKDKRNLRLLKVGLILPNSEESEGVSSSDMAKRAQLERLKNQKLKNVNFFVSDKRLMIHNLPKTLTDAKLRKILKDAAGKGAVVTEARVMRDFKKTSAEGIPLSRGFGFASFSRHEDALKAIEKLNNHPKLFTPNKRPIVEFSVENKVALLTKERRIEKLQQRNKKRTEERIGRKSNQNAKTKSGISSDPKIPSRKSKKRKKSAFEVKESPTHNKVSGSSPRKKQKKDRNESSDIDPRGKVTNNFQDSQISIDNASKKKQKKKNRRRSKKKTSPEKSGSINQETFNNMVDKFKKKLLNKI